MSVLEETPGLASELIRMRWAHHNGVHHTWHPNAYFLDSVCWRALFHGKYTRVRDACFELVSADFSKDKGVTKAWKLRDGISAQLDTMITQRHPSLVQQPKTGRNMYKVAIHLPTLDALVSEATCPQIRLQLQAVRAACHMTDGDVAYLFQEYQQSGEVGRRFPVGVSITCLPRECTHRLMAAMDKHLQATTGKRIYNVDMVNAHPRLLVMALNNELLITNEHATLVEYVNNRKAILENLQAKYECTRDEVKKLILAIMFGATLDKRAHSAIRWDASDYMHGGPRAYEQFYYSRPQHVRSRMAVEGTSSWLEAFHRSVCAAQVALSTTERFKSCFGHSTYSASAVAICLQDMENQVLSAAEDYHRSINDVICVPMYDGYILETDTVDVVALRQHVLDATGFDISFDVKGFN